MRCLCRVVPTWCLYSALWKAGQHSSCTRASSRDGLQQTPRVASRWRRFGRELSAGGGNSLATFERTKRFGMERRGGEVRIGSDDCKRVQLYLGPQRVGGTLLLHSLFPTVQEVTELVEE